jgi:pimeloyl-ACP methyl ester carboxylesterase
MKLFKLIFCTLLTSTQFSLFAQIQGKWHSNFQVAGKSLLMDLEIQGIGRDGSITISIPDQPKMKPQLMEEYVLFSDSLSFNWNMIGLSYAAKLQGDSIVGIMSQSGLSWKAVFYKEAQIAKTVAGKMQDPKAPFPYHQQELIVKADKKIQLAGTLILPEIEKNKSFPLVIMVSGSGAQDRDCEILGHRPFWVLADAMGRQGIASFRYDDRGVGKSSGSFKDATQVDFSNDLLAIISHLKKAYPQANLYIYGHSEGGMTALRAAVENTQIAGIIESASVGSSGLEVLVDQQYFIPKASGYSEEEALWNQRFYAEGAKIAINSTEKTFSNLYKTWLSQAWDSIPSKLLAGASQEDVLGQMNAFFNNDWARQFLAFEAKPYLQQLNLPFLIINGAADVQVPPTKSQEAFRNNLSAVSLSKSTFLIVEGANHLFQHCNTCAVTEYASLEQTLDPTLIKATIDWILEQQRAHQ